MTKTLEITLIILLSLFSFFLGVKYSNSIKEHAGWLFELNGDEVALPDLSNTQNPEMDMSIDENNKTIEQGNQPAEDQNIVPSIEEGSESIEQIPDASKAQQKK